MAAITYLQPATRAEISRLAGREISRDVIARLKRLDLIDAGLPRAQTRRALRLRGDKEVLEGLRPWGHDRDFPQSYSKQE